MSGVRRKTKYRKNVENDVLESLPEPGEGEEIVRVITSRGGNLLEIETKEGAISLCRIPQRFRGVVWVKRGTLLIVGSCTDDFKTADGSEGKVKYVVNHVIFTTDQIKHLQQKGLLPALFETQDKKKKESLQEQIMNPKTNIEENESEEDEEEEDVSGNPNRRFQVVESDSSDEEE